MKKGFVAFIDVLGFKDILLSENFEELFKHYQISVNRATSYFKKNKLQYVVFSDSIIINTLDEKEESLLAILRACSSLYYLFLNINFPIRGCISYGSFERIPDESGGGVIVAGKSILDAYYYEEEQDWIGIMISPTLLRAYKTVEKKIMEVPLLLEKLRIKTEQSDIEKLKQILRFTMYYQKYKEIPFHSKIPDEDKNIFFTGFAIVPTNPESDTYHKYMDTLTLSSRFLETTKLFAPNHQAQRKYDNSINWLGNVMLTWSELAKNRRPIIEEVFRNASFEYKVS